MSEMEMLREKFFANSARLLARHPDGLSLEQFQSSYQRYFKCGIEHEKLGARTFLDLIGKSRGFFKIKKENMKRFITLGDEGLKVLTADQENPADPCINEPIEEILLERLLPKTEKIDFKSQGVDVNELILPEAVEQRFSEISDVIRIPGEIIKSISDTVDAFVLIGGGIRSSNFKKRYDDIMESSLEPELYRFLDTRQMLLFLSEIGLIAMYTRKERKEGQIREVERVGCNQQAARNTRLILGTGYLKQFMDYGDTLPRFPYEETFKTGRSFNLKVYEIYTTKNFFVLDIKYREQLTKINEDITQFYNLYPGKLRVKVEDIRPGLIAAAFHKPSGFWYRAQVIRVTEPGKVFVLFLDDGGKFRCSFSELRYLHIRHGYMPPLAINARLYGIDAGKKALGMFLKLVVDKEDDSEDKIFKGVVKYTGKLRKAVLELVLYDLKGNNLNQTLVDKECAKLQKGMILLETEKQQELDLKAQLFNQWIDEFNQKVRVQENRSPTEPEKKFISEQREMLQRTVSSWEL